jgi:hypothetical protein
MIKGETMKNLSVICAVLLLLGAIAGPLSTNDVSARSSNQPAAVPASTPLDKPPFSEYKSVSIGTTTSIVRNKLGSPKEKSDDQDFYVFSDNESAQFFYDKAHLVTAIMITYTGDIKSAPSPMTVLGEEVTANPDGGIFKMVRFPKAGYWISYNRSGGEGPVVSIAMQKF